MMSIVHLTGDASLLRGTDPPADDHARRASTAGCPTADKAAVRAMALDALRAYRDRGCTLPPPPSPETIREMMSFMVGEEVPDEYVPMLLEEMALDGGDARDVDVGRRAGRAARRASTSSSSAPACRACSRRSASSRPAFPYVVHREERRRRRHVAREQLSGLPRRRRQPLLLLLVRAQPRLAGVLLAARRAARVLRALRRPRTACARTSASRTEVVAARWDDAAARWELRLRTRDGGEETLDANALISAVGQLNRPRLPDIPGRESFAGPAFHSARVAARARPRAASASR